MSKLILTNISSGYLTATATNANNDAIVTAIENTLSRDGTSPNQMNSDLDMNGHRVLNILAQSGDGFIWKGVWVTGTVYALNSLVSNSGSSYICAVAHTAGSVFATDLAAGKWTLLAQKGDSGAGTGDMLISNNLSELTATAATARGNISAAKSGANTDITSLTATLTGDVTGNCSGKASGSIAQVVNYTTGAYASGTTQIPYDDTIPQNTEGDQYMSLVITPTNASSTLIIDIIVNLVSSGTFTLTSALFVDSTSNALAAISNYVTSNNPRSFTFKHFISAGSTSARTYKIRSGANGAGTTGFNGASGTRKLGGVSSSSITITEILP